MVKLLGLLAALCLSSALRAEDSRPPLNPLTAKAITEFQAGDKAAACADSSAALAQNPLDKSALGISKMTCGEKAINNKDFQAKPDDSEKTEKTDLKPKPFSGKANGPQEPQPPPPQPEGSLQGQSGSGLETGGLPAENIPSQVITASPSGPALRDQPTTYDKLMESQSLLAEGKLVEAADAARRAVELQPKNRRAFGAWAEATRQMRNYDAVLSVTDLGLKSFPNDLDLLKNKIFALNKKKDYAAAIALADQALALYATDATLLTLKAYALGRSGDHDGMVKALETACALDPNFEPLLMDARKSKDGEPFIMPGDSKEEPKTGIPVKRERAPINGLLIFGGLLVLLGILAALAVLGVFKRSEPEPPSEP